jgi:hypothetical protein
VQNVTLHCIALCEKKNWQRTSWALSKSLSLLVHVLVGMIKHDTAATSFQPAGSVSRRQLGGQGVFKQSLPSL